MSYSSPSLQSDGLHLPTYDERMEDLLSKYKTIFGTDVYTGADSPDYQLLSLFARAMDDMQDTITNVYNARNPSYASGDALDLLLPLCGIRRRSATASTATLSLTGTAGESLPAGMQAGDDNSRLWTIAKSVTFDDDGNATATASCETLGAIVADVGTITNIMTPTAAWTSVTNTDCTVGTDVETDNAVRVRRSTAVSMPSRSIKDGITASLVVLNGVTFAKTVENNTDATDDNGIPSHSICCVVSGGESADIAEAIYMKKAPGVGTYGNTSASYTDPYGGSNTMYFSRPETQTVEITIELRKLNGFDETNDPASIKSAVAEYVNSLGIGDDLIVSGLYSPAFGAVSGDSLTYAITSISALNTAKSGVVPTTDTITAAYNVTLRTTVDDVTVKVNNA